MKCEAFFLDYQGFDALIGLEILEYSDVAEAVEWRQSETERELASTNG